ncbi:ROK family protein [Pseudobacter ginsenosidimutans]|uniref:Glucokinase n=1 Tax=Pseudobacter ginsenosidimutans TaxID=661488 RepID=A0A4V2F1Y7_9BACT|nr:ROK family protein [Pseudobacter ginsenosidimutans]QEC43980.1 ROK family protein [Pseudobacter ginsenosidimutans]RZS75416.1 glucokinase [Pseudobacter ginsenosidimutans]
MKVLGIDIGGSHISTCIVELNNASFLRETEVHAKVDPSGSSENLISAWAAVIRESFEKAGEPVGYIGIAMPGPFDYEKGISLVTGLHKFESLYGLNVKELLAGSLGIDPDKIRFINDASAFLLGEVKGGAGKGFANAAGITLGTGLGSAGYFLHTLQDGDLWCTPFKASRAEDYLCSRWVVQEYKRISGKTISGVKDLMHDDYRDEYAKQVFDVFGQHLGEVLLMKYPPSIQDVVVIGGNIAKAWDCFIPAAQQYLAAQGASMNLQPALLGEDAAIMGAACLWS